MGDPARSNYYVSPEAYLAEESSRPERWEYLAGAVYQMAGASAGHNRIVGNMFAALRNQLANGPCEIFATDLKVRIRTNTAEFYYYPDLTVDGSRLPNGAQFAEQPKVIVEVLSPETERIDRGEKLRNYQSLPSLDAYVLVDQQRWAVTAYRRHEGSFGRELLTAASDQLLLPTIGCAVALAVIYERCGLSAG
jgi:Uma2 family endonuclease